MPEGWEFDGTRLISPSWQILSLPALRALLATQGLHIVNEASAKVLEAMFPKPCVASCSGCGLSEDACLRHPVLPCCPDCSCKWRRCWQRDDAHQVWCAR